MLLGQEDVLAADLRREWGRERGGIISQPRLSTAGAEVIKCQIFCVYTRDEHVESLKLSLPDNKNTPAATKINSLGSSKNAASGFWCCPCTLPPWPWRLGPRATKRAFKQQHLLAR